MKKIFKEIVPYIFIIIVVLLFRTYVATPAAVDGSSMENTLYDHDLVIINKIILQFDKISRFDIVVIENELESDRIIKRVIGLPGEKIEYKDNLLYVDGNRIMTSYKFEDTEDFTATVGENEYFVLGDNRDISKDSRYLGNFKRENIIGLVGFRFYPFDKIGSVK